MKLQIDRMIAKFFAGLPNDEQLNFSVAVTVMKVQRKWRARMRTLRVSFCTLADVLIEAVSVRALLRQGLMSLAFCGRACLSASGLPACFTIGQQADGAVQRQGSLQSRQLCVCWLNTCPVSNLGFHLASADAPAGDSHNPWAPSPDLDSAEIIKSACRSAVGEPSGRPASGP